MWRGRRWTWEIDRWAGAVVGDIAAGVLLSGSVLGFFNRGREEVKLLWWDRHGVWLAYQRLERGRFRGTIPGQLAFAELSLLLAGIALLVKRFRAVRSSRVG